MIGNYLMGVWKMSSECLLGIGWVESVWKAGLHKTGIRGIQDTRQIVDGKTNDIENNDNKGGSKPLT